MVRVERLPRGISCFRKTEKSLGVVLVALLLVLIAVWLLVGLSVVWTTQSSARLATKHSTLSLEQSRITTTKKKEQPAQRFPLVECTVTTPYYNDRVAVPLHEEAKSGTTTAAGAHGVIEITLRSDMAPVACQYFLELVQAEWYNNVFIFRVLEGFIAQWGARFDREPAPPPQPPTVGDTNNTMSNIRGTLSFAGGRPKARQVFVNLGHNVRLDKESSHPFATVSEASLTNVLDHLYMGYKDGQGQIPALREGIMLEKFPYMSQVHQCRVVSSFTRSGVGGDM